MAAALAGALQQARRVVEQRPDEEADVDVSSSRWRRRWGRPRSATFEEGALLAVNLRPDADTTGAIYGQLAGAYDSLAAIPSGWRDTLSSRDLLERYAD